MAYEWRDHFRRMFEERGYTMTACHYDPMYGWTIEFESEPGEVHEMECATTVSVQTRIRLLRDLTTSEVN